MDMIDIATSDLAALSWQISPLFVIFSLMLCSLSIYVIPYIIHKLNTITATTTKLQVIACGIAAFITAFNIWVVNLLLLLDIKLFSFKYNLFLLLPLLMLSIVYFLLFYLKVK